MHWHFICRVIYNLCCHYGHSVCVCVCMVVHMIFFQTLQLLLLLLLSFWLRCKYFALIWRKIHNRITVLRLFCFPAIYVYMHVCVCVVSVCAYVCIALIESLTLLSYLRPTRCVCVTYYYCSCLLLLLLLLQQSQGCMQTVYGWLIV